MKTNYRKTTVNIDLSAYKHNLAIVRESAPSSKLMAVIKSNAYGHGILQTANYLQSEVDAFAVSSTDEAIFLRENHIDNEIIILEGFQEQEELEEMLKYNLIPVIHQQYQINLLHSVLMKTITNKTLSLWVKLDTGMNRLGLKSSELDSFAKDLLKLEDTINVLGFMSHFACADEPEHQQNHIQRNNFKEMLRSFLSSLNHYSNKDNKYQIENYLLSFSNSAAILSQSEAHFQWVRPGVILYGINPLGDNYLDISPTLKPVMSFTSKVIAIKTLSKGESVGYGASYTANNKQKIAIVSVGYGDGYPRHAKPGTPIRIGRHQVGLIGRVSMDMICCDISHLSDDDVKIGTVVELWGKSISVSEIAKYSSTIAYELVCGITSRVEFIYQD